MTSQGEVDVLIREGLTAEDANLVRHLLELASRTTADQTQV